MGLCSGLWSLLVPAFCTWTTKRFVFGNSNIYYLCFAIQWFYRIVVVGVLYCISQEQRIQMCLDQLILNYLIKIY